MEVLTIAAQNKEKNTVWINEEERVASFHPVEGYTMQEFSSREFFMSYLLSLQQCGFRFW